ncbi:MAG: F-type H+-transporting ATPase subunit gamma [Candidatus Marinamargulisbacteria bacterium]|jgi:F-type H+-transporting ATPase subunit gamma
MAQSKDIKDRIGSVKKTKKITQAMKMVSAAKFKRATQETMRIRPFLQGFNSILQRLSLDPSVLESSAYLDSNGNDKRVVILVTSDRGLCGGFNSHLIKFAQSVVGEDPENTEMVIFGNKGYQHFRRRGVTIVDHHLGFSEGLRLEKVAGFITPLMERFLKKEIGKIQILFNEFGSALSSHLVNQQLLPLKIEASAEEASGVSNYFFEPSDDAIVDELAKQTIVTSIYRAFVESRAAEEGARMAAMDSATDNASDMIKGLTLLYNRTRQAQITTELSEIVAGAEALVN